MIRPWLGVCFCCTIAAAQAVESLPGTRPLTGSEDLSGKMMDGAHRFVERKIGESIVARQRRWSRDLSSRAAYERSVEANRKRFLEKTGVVDARVAPRMERIDDVAGARVHQVRWNVLEGVASAQAESVTQG